MAKKLYIADVYSSSTNNGEMNWLNAKQTEKKNNTLSTKKKKK